MNTVDKMDLFFASAPGVAMTMGADFYSHKLLRDVFTKAGPFGNDPHVFGPGYKGVDFSDKLTNEFGARHRTYYNRKGHGFRNMLHRASGGMVEHSSARVESYVLEKSLIDAGRATQPGAFGFRRPAGLPEGVNLNPEAYKKINNALRFRTFAIGVTGVWGAAMLGSLASSAVGHFRQKGAEIMGQRWGISPEGFSDSRMAYTSRQRALRAIQSSQSGYRRAIGNEASFIHTYR